MASVSASAPTSPLVNGSSPAARRPRRATWRDPRLAVGVAIVAASVLLGARLLGGADDTVAVWAVRADLSDGTTVRADDLVRRNVRFSSAADADRYLPADTALPTGATLNRAVGAGEMLPRAALAATGPTPLIEVPLAVATDAVPATVRSGSVVDVWVTPDASSVTRRTESIIVFDDVTVVSAPQTGSALGPSATRQVIVGIDSAQQDALASALAQTSTGAIVITRQG